jgi:hypothetical protein
MSRKTKTIRRKARYYWRKNLQRIIDEEVARRLKRCLTALEGGLSIDEIRASVGLEPVKKKDSFGQKFKKWLWRFRWPN